MRASRLLPAFVLLGAMLAGTACAAESPKTLAQKPAPAAPSTAPPSLAHLEKWVGKYPGLDDYYDRLPEGKGFFDDPVLRRLMEAALPPRIVHVIRTGWDGASVETPVERHDGMAVVSVCKEHECFTNRATVFVHLQPVSNRSRVEVCWVEFDAKQRESKSFWLGASTIRLERDACSWHGGGIEAYRKLWKRGMETKP